ncbi:MAG: DegT/DnrJ/EryC1/StrS aminotransferase family protein [Planctomycetota bacterium]
MSTDPLQLAIHGGQPAVTTGPFEWPPANAAIEEAVRAVYGSGDWGRYHGQYCDRLIGLLAEQFAVDYVQLTCSGTIAVELALRAVGVTAGDEVLLAGYDFPGNFRAIEAVGATPVLIDIGSDTWTIEFEALEATAAEEIRRVKAIVVSHLHGDLTPMRRLMEIAERHGWKVVEDACQSPGAVVDGQPAGSWGDAGVLSFGGSKLLTSGRGGALLTSDPAVAQRARIYASRGNDAYAMSELQAAVLAPQLNELSKANARRAESVVRLHDALLELASLLQGNTPKEQVHAYYKYPWRLTTERLRSTRDSIIAALQAQGAPIDAGFRGFGKRSSRRCRQIMPLENSEAAARGTLLLHHPVLLASPQAIEQVAEAMKKVIAHYG